MQIDFANRRNWLVLAAFEIRNKLVRNKSKVAENWRREAY